jgi:type IX secretion system PorP/SprF family membrane protein
MKDPGIFSAMTGRTVRNHFFILIQFLLFHFSLEGHAQQQPLYSQFTFNKYLFNPAVAGCEQIPVIQLSAYEQWIGFEGAPKFHTVTFDTRIFQETREPRRNIRLKFKLFKPGTVGTGVQIFNEKYGTLSHTGLTATYSYHMKLGEHRLSFGFSPVLSNLGLRSSDIILSDDQFDELVEGKNTRRWIVDFDFGVYLVKDEYFAGYSVHHLSRSALQWGGTTDADYLIGRQHYFMGGYRYKYSEKLLFEPSMLIKISEDRKDQIDINLKCNITDKYWCGISYKTSKTLSVFGGLQYDRYLFCYAFDMTLTPIRKFNYGSHELLLAVQLGQTIKRYLWLDTY